MNRERCEKHGVTGCLACFRAAPVVPMPTIQRAESVRDRMDPGDLPADLQAEMGGNNEVIAEGMAALGLPSSIPLELLRSSGPAPKEIFHYEEDPLVLATLAFTNAKVEYEKAKIAQKAATEALVKATDEELQARADMNRALKALQTAVGTAEVITTDVQNPRSPGT